MTDAFVYVLFGVVIVGVVVALVTLGASGDAYGHIGRGGLSIGDDAQPTRPAALPGAGTAERDEEIRQLLEARNARRARRGQAPIDLDEELRRLTAAPAPADRGLREEVRQLVVARNERRVRGGKAPLDVGAEVERRLRELSG